MPFLRRNSIFLYRSATLAERLTYKDVFISYMKIDNSTHSPKYNGVVTLKNSHSPTPTTEQDGIIPCHCQPLYPSYLGLWLELEDGLKLKIIVPRLAHLSVVQIRPCNARQQSYHSDPSHVKHSTKIRGVSRDTPYLGPWFEFGGGSKLQIILLCLAHLLVVEIWRCNARERSYDSVPLHVGDCTKIRGVSRDHPYLGL